MEKNARPLGPLYLYKTVREYLGYLKSISSTAASSNNIAQVNDIAAAAELSDAKPIEATATINTSGIRMPCLATDPRSIAPVIFFRIIFVKTQSSRDSALKGTQFSLPEDVISTRERGEIERKAIS